MNILITGGSGFIGTNLVEFFSKGGHNIINLDIVRPRNSNHGKYWRYVNLCDRSTLVEAVRDFRPEILLHMGARTDLNGSSVEEYAANTTGVENLIAAVNGISSLRRIIFASSRLVCRIGYTPLNELDYCPTTHYGESKVIGEKFVWNAIRYLPCPALIVRPTSIWGPWFDVPYKTFFLTIAGGHYVHPGRSQILKSFGFIGNAVHEIERLMLAPSDLVAGRMFYLADYPPIDVADWANMIQRALQVAPLKRISVRALRVVACLGDALKGFGWENPPLTSFRLDNLLTPMVHDLTPLQSVVGTLPYSVEEGVQMTVDWLREQGEVS